jgi:phospholipase/carboxylesterase
MNVITVPAIGAPQGNIVLMHGWGANHDDLVELVPYLQLSSYQFLLPNGIFEHQYSETGKTWYSFTGAGQLTASSRQELATSRQLLQDWLLTLPQTTGVALDRTWIGGFSQGGAMALDVGLDLAVAGIMVLSGYLHPELTAPAHCPPVVILHGRQDEVVPIEAAWQTRQQLLNWGAVIQYHELEMGHTIIPAELQIVRQFVCAEHASEPPS